MFPNTDMAVTLEKALQALATPGTEDRLIWLHDYNEACYREKKDYTRNGLHWGYPESVVNSILGDGDPHYACFVGTIPKSDEKYHYEGNSRFSKVRYGDVRESIEKSLQQDLVAAQKAAKKEVKAREKWMAAVETKFGHLLPAVLHLDAVQTTLAVYILNPDRMVQHGFGFFLEDIKKGDVSCTQRAKDLLSKTPSRGGLNAVEIFKGPIFAGCAFQRVVSRFEAEEISVDPNGFKDLAKVWRLK